jgi:hypothetical protein
MVTATPFDRDAIVEAFRRIGARAHAEGRRVEIAVYGGAAMVLTFEERRATRDVDAVFHTDPAWLRSVTAAVAGEFGWSSDWLNDGVKGFLSVNDSRPESKAPFATYPSEGQPGLRVFLASPHYLLAMKCIAMRLGSTESEDQRDIRTLILSLGITSPAEAFDIVEAFYPRRSIPPRTQFGLEGIFEDLAAEGLLPTSPGGPP